MTADNSGKVSAGSVIKSVPATIWNNMIDAGQSFANQRLSSSTPSPTRARATDLLKLRNSSGESRRKGEILRIDGKVIEKVTDESIWLDGKEPEPDCRFGILKGPALNEEVETAQVSGVCMALVNITDADHTFARAVDGEYVLQSWDSGPLEILYKPDGTDELDCVVRFAGAVSARKLFRIDGTGPEAFYRGSHPSGADATEVLYDGTDGDEEDLYFDFVRGCYITGDIVAAYQQDDKWQAFDGGRHFFRNAVTTADSSSGSVTVELFAGSGIEVTATTTYNLLDESPCQVNFDAGSDEITSPQAASFEVTGTACPEAVI
ncbi:MAG: hypothetical protein KF777_00195 [Planctomycetaceae bacterium]|nr:hypothetical protein [Planctomycetaceae bacterium]